MKRILIIMMMLFSITSIYSQDITNNHPSEVNIINGLYDMGNLNSLVIINDDNYYRIYETNLSSEAILINITIPISSDIVSTLNINHNYRGGASHQLVLSIYDENINDFVELDSLGNSLSLHYDIYDISSINVTNEVIIQYSHIGTGVETHYVDIEYISVISEIGIVGISRDNPLFIDLENDAHLYIFILLFVLLMLSFLVIIHPVNALLLLFFSVIIMANGFNILISFFLMLLSIVMITYASKQ